MTDECKHDADPLIITTGSYHFTAGDVWDDIVEHVICPLCGEHLDCEHGCKEMKIEVDV
jgi:hypothetical protein